MFWTIVTALLVVIGVAVIAFGVPSARKAKAAHAERLADRGYGRTPTAPPPPAAFVGVGGAFIAFGLLILILCSFTLVKATEVGIPVAFGKVGKPMAAGVHWTKPWVSVETYPIRPLTTEQTVDVRTSEGGKVTARVAARWVVIEEKASETYFQARTGDENAIQEKIVDPNLRQAVNTVYSAKTNVDAANDRTDAPGKILTEANRLLADYGIKMSTVLLRQVDPDEQTARAVASYAAEQQKTRIAEQATKTAEQEAARNKVSAEGVKDAAAQLPSGLSEQQVALLCAQAWERVAASAVEKGVALYTAPCGGSVAVAGAGAR